MTPHLVGDWLDPAGLRYRLQPDGTCTVLLPGGRDARHGTWHPAGPDAFEIALPRAGFPDARPEPGAGHDAVMHFLVLSHGPGRLLVEGREGGADGLVLGAVEWHRDGFYRG
jgi:hypothetical protein